MYYNELVKLKNKIKKKTIDFKILKLLLDQYEYAYFDSDFKRECKNFIEKHKEIIHK